MAQKMTTTGHNLEIFQPGQNNVVSWLQQFSFYANLHDYPKDKQKYLLLTHISTEAFETLGNLVTPTDLDDKTITVDTLKDKLKTHYHTKINPHVAVQAFQNIHQEASENITGFALRLRRAANDCSFGSTYDERLRAQFIIGLADVEAKEKIYCNPKLTTFEKCLTTAVEREQLHLQFKRLCVTTTTSGSSVHAINSQQQQPRRTNNNNNFNNNNNNRYNNSSSNNNGNDNSNHRQSSQSTCRRCGRDHRGESCRFINATCHHCGLRGHIQTVCLRKARGEPAVAKQNINAIIGEEEELQRQYQQQQQHYETQQQQYESQSAFGGQINRVEPDRNYQQQQPENSSSDDGHIYRVTNGSTIPDPSIRAIRVRVMINDRSCNMELDTGASVSLMSRTAFQQLGLDPALIQPTQQRLLSYTNATIPITGVAHVRVRTTAGESTLPLFVTPEGPDALLGLSWLTAFGLQSLLQNNITNVNPSGYHNTSTNRNTNDPSGVNNNNYDRVNINTGNTIANRHLNISNIDNTSNTNAINTFNNNNNVNSNIYNSNTATNNRDTQFAYNHHNNSKPGYHRLGGESRTPSGGAPSPRLGGAPGWRFPGASTNTSNNITTNINGYNKTNTDDNNNINRPRSFAEVVRHLAQPGAEAASLQDGSASCRGGDVWTTVTRRSRRQRTPTSAAVKPRESSQHNTTKRVNLNNKGTYHRHQAEAVDEPETATVLPPNNLYEPTPRAESQKLSRRSAMSES
jgi:hypothetical protein